MISTKDIYTELCNKSKAGHQLTDDELNALQERLFKMYRDLEAVCKRHNLRIMMAYGNVIGALRHGGWIPWDDDLDVHMPREDYDKLLNEYVDELPPQYRVYAPHTKWGPSYRFAKMVDTSTTFVPLGGGNPKYYPGVFVDIFPVENISTNKFLNTLRKYWCFFLSYTATSVEDAKGDGGEYKKLMCSTRAGAFNYYLRRIWGKVFSFASPARWFCWIDRFNKLDKKTGFVHVPTDTTLRYAWQPLPEEMYFPMREYELKNGEKIVIPNKAEEYLELVYGDWRKIPPTEKIWHHYVNEINI